MNKFITKLLLPLFFFTTPAIADVYKCPSADGKITYTQIPCKTGSRKVKGKWGKSDKRKKLDKVVLVYETSKTDEIVLLELYQNEIVFSELISRRKYDKVMTLKPPTYFIYEDVEYIRDRQLNTIFWGKSGDAIPVSVDGKLLKGFFYIKKQIRAKGKSAKDALKIIKSASSLKLERHYWGANDKKEYIYFSLKLISNKLDSLAPRKSLQ